MDTMIINQQNKINYNGDLQKVIIKVADGVAKMAGLGKESELSVLIVDNSYIRELNFIYRGQNKSTDVLSFAMNELAEEEPEFEFSKDINILGDIVISLEQAEEQCQEYGHSLERELGYLVAHGMLHLLGYDHENEDERKVMRELEDKIMHNVKLAR